MNKEKLIKKLAELNDHDFAYVKTLLNEYGHNSFTTFADMAEIIKQDEDAAFDLIDILDLDL